MHLTEKQKGEGSVFLSAALWSVFPIITKLTFTSISPLLSVALSTLIAAVFFAVVLTVRKQWPHLLRRAAWKSMFLVTLFIGIFYYGLTFVGLQYTTAGNASILGLMEVFFAFVLLGWLLRHESLSPGRILGACCMVAGAGLILLPKVSSWQMGNLLIILATACAPIGNMFAQRARQIVSSETIMFFRSVLSGVFLLLLALLFESKPTSQDLLSSSGFLLVNGFLLLGISKVLWIEGIKRIPITAAVSLEAIIPALTLGIAFFVLHEKISIVQIIGLLPILIGMFLLTSIQSATSASRQ